MTTMTVELQLQRRCGDGSGGRTARPTRRITPTTRHRHPTRRRPAHRFIAEWPNRDPINELGFKLLTRSRGAFNSGEEKNLYAFVGNNPVSRFDPDGQKKKGPIAILIGLLTGCGKGPKAPNLPTLDANCAADPQVKQDYQRLIDCNSADGDGNAECAIICDCLAQGGGPAVNVCYNNCRNAYAKRCP